MMVVRVLAFFFVLSVLGTEAATCQSSADCLDSSKPFCLRILSDKSNGYVVGVKKNFWIGVCTECLADCDCKVNQYCGMGVPYPTMASPNPMMPAEFSQELVLRTPHFHGDSLRGVCKNYEWEKLDKPCRHRSSGSDDREGFCGASTQIQPRCMSCIGDNCPPCSEDSPLWNENAGKPGFCPRVNSTMMAATYRWYCSGSPCSATRACPSNGVQQVTCRRGNWYTAADRFCAASALKPGPRCRPRPSSSSSYRWFCQTTHSSRIYPCSSVTTCPSSPTRTVKCGRSYRSYIYLYSSSYSRPDYYCPSPKPPTTCALSVRRYTWWCTDGTDLQLSSSNNPRFYRCSIATTACPPKTRRRLVGCGPRDTSSNYLYRSSLVADVYCQTSPEAKPPAVCTPPLVLSDHYTWLCSVAGDSLMYPCAGLKTMHCPASGQRVVGCSPRVGLATPSTLVDDKHCSAAGAKPSTTCGAQKYAWFCSTSAGADGVVGHRHHCTRCDGSGDRNSWCCATDGDATSCAWEDRATDAACAGVGKPTTTHVSCSSSGSAVSSVTGWFCSTSTSSTATLSASACTQLCSGQRTVSCCMTQGSTCSSSQRVADAMCSGPKPGTDCARWFCTSDMSTTTGATTALCSSCESGTRNVYLCPASSSSCSAAQQLSPVQYGLLAPPASRPTTYCNVKYFCTKYNTPSSEATKDNCHQSCPAPGGTRTFRLCLGTRGSCDAAQALDVALLPAATSLPSLPSKQCSAGGTWFCTSDSRPATADSKRAMKESCFECPPSGRREVFCVRDTGAGVEADGKTGLLKELSCNSNKPNEICAPECGTYATCHDCTSDNTCIWSAVTRHCYPRMLGGGGGMISSPSQCVLSALPYIQSFTQYACTTTADWEGECGSDRQCRICREGSRRCRGSNDGGGEQLCLHGHWVAAAYTDYSARTLGASALSQASLTTALMTAFLLLLVIATAACKRFHGVDAARAYRKRYQLQQQQQRAAAGAASGGNAKDGAGGGKKAGGGMFGKLKLKKGAKQAQPQPADSAAAATAAAAVASAGAAAAGAAAAPLQSATAVPTATTPAVDTAPSTDTALPGAVPSPAAAGGAETRAAAKV